MKRMLFSGLLALAVTARLAAPSWSQSDDGPDAEPRRVDCTEAKAAECAEIRDLIRRYSQSECPKGTRGIEVAGRCVATGGVMGLGSGLPLFELRIYDGDLPGATTDEGVIRQVLQIAKQLSIMTKNKITEQTGIVLARYINNVANAASEKNVLLFWVAGSLADALLDSGASSNRPEGWTPSELARLEKPMKPVHILEAIGPGRPPFFVPAAILILVRSGLPPTAVRPGVTGVAAPPR